MCICVCVSVLEKNTDAAKSRRTREQAKHHWGLKEKEQREFIRMCICERSVMMLCISGEGYKTINGRRKL